MSYDIPTSEVPIPAADAGFRYCTENAALIAADLAALHDKYAAWEAGDAIPQPTGVILGSGCEAVVAEVQGPYARRTGRTDPETHARRVATATVLGARVAGLEQLVAVGGGHTYAEVIDGGRSHDDVLCLTAKGIAGLLDTLTIAQSRGIATSAGQNLLIGQDGATVFDLRYNPSQPLTEKVTYAAHSIAFDGVKVTDPDELFEAAMFRMEALESMSLQVSRREQHHGFWQGATASVRNVIRDLRQYA